MSRAQHEPMVREVAEQYGLDPATFCALVETESSWDAAATRFEPGYRYLIAANGEPIRWPSGSGLKPPQLSWSEFIAQKTSWGLCQVMGAVAREAGFDGTFGQLLIEPRLGVVIGAQLLARHAARYPIDEALGAYNAGPGNRSSAAGQAYAGKVMARRGKYTGGA